jgi:hypothetical protein
MAIFKFSGHETFQCRHFWLKKGYDFIKNKGDFKSNEALIELGVGKNMVASINYWTKVFGLVDNGGQTSVFADKIFSKDGFDPYLEDIGTLFLLHYRLISNVTEASIYHLAFEEFRRTRIASEFTERQLNDFICKKMIQHNLLISEKTIANDVKVFIRNYTSGTKKNNKSVEDDFASIFIELGFIEEVPEVRLENQALYRINYSVQENLSEQILLFLILDAFDNEVSISVEAIQNQISDKLLCNREGTDDKLNKLVEEEVIVYKQDAGRKEIQMKKKLDKWSILEKYYGRV